MVSKSLSKEVRNVSFAFFLVVLLDILWINFLAKDFYLKNIGHLYRDPVIIWSALVVWLLIVIGIRVFVVPSAGRKYGRGVFFGGLFGFILYGVYDFTNYAVLTWPLNVTLVDIVWGTFLCAAVSSFLILLERRLK
jgi:uncharacterized membrane protein